MPNTTGRALERAALDALNSRGIPASIVSTGGGCTAVEVILSDRAWILLSDDYNVGQLDAGLYVPDPPSHGEVAVISACSPDVDVIVQFVERCLESHGGAS